jgi:hypothetical protein
MPGRPSKCYTADYKDIENLVIETLRKAVMEYHSGRGHFLPYAENRIHVAIKEYQWAVTHSPKGKHLRHAGYRQEVLDINAEKVV